MDGPGEIFALRNFTTSLIAGAGEPHQLVRKISHESPSKFHITEKLKKNRNKNMTYARERKGSSCIPGGGGILESQVRL